MSSSRSTRSKTSTKTASKASVKAVSKPKSKTRSAALPFKRLMLKISGEVLGGAQGSGIEATALESMAVTVAGLVKAGFEVAVTVGGGNFWRYRDHEALPLPRATSDAVGMLATVMNGRLLQEALALQGISARTLAPHVGTYFAENYQPNLGRELLEIGEVVICAGGTGNPYFTTDSSAALRALELGCDVLIKGTKVDGVYDRDPQRFKDATRFDSITYDEVLDRELGVMDLTAILLCKEGELPVLVCRAQEPNDVMDALQGRLPSTRLVPSSNW